MRTELHEIAEDVFRISTYVEPVDLVFNQFLIVAEQPLLWHCGHRQLFPAVLEALGRVLPPAQLRWISFGHVEADELGAMNHWLGAAEQAEVVQGSTGVLVSVNDLADRSPRALSDGEVFDLGGRRVRWIDTPHVPHGWDAGLIYEETTRTLFVGDLFTMTGRVPASTDGDIVTPAITFEDHGRASAVTPASGVLGLRVQARRVELQAMLAGYGLRNSRLFGSIARGEEGPESDVDLLVDVPEGVGLVTLGRCQAELEVLLGARVDLVPAGALKSGVAVEVLVETVPL
ncbi:MAG: oxygen-binding di-iron domain-containing protein [Acidimicrobiales bacterium]